MFRQDCSCPALLEDRRSGFPYGAVTRYGPPFQTLPVPKSTAAGLVRFRSPLLAESRLMSVPPATEMFQFAGFASCRARASRLALAPVRGGVPGCVFPVGDPAGRTASRIRRNEGHLVDALALRGDEGRGTLRKARGRCERSLIPGSPNGATHPAQGKLWRVSLSESIGQGGEPGELKHLSSRRNGHQPRLRE